MTPGEKNFVLRVEHLLNKSKAPNYQQLVIEALHALRVILKANPTLAINGYIIVDVLIGHAVRLAWLDLHPEQEGIYNESRGAAWASFYASPPIRPPTPSWRHSPTFWNKATKRRRPLQNSTKSTELIHERLSNDSGRRYRRHQNRHRPLHTHPSE